MKKLLFFAVAVLTLAACTGNKVSDAPGATMSDSLQRIVEQKENEINDIMGTLNDINEGLREISEAEGRVTLARSGEGANQKQKIQEDIKFIQERMNQNRELLDKLRKQLRESTFKGDQLKRTVENLTKQLEQKDIELQNLREELDKKDIHITELDETISNLNTDVTNLKTESEQKSATISNQDQQLNTAWFVFGTKKELKEQGILDGGRVLQGNFNKSYFTKIDIRVQKEIKLYSKKAEMKTSHPSSSYVLEKDAKGQYVLRITDPQTFWSTSKYLVIEVK
ncbi:MAG: lipoprotein [Prevotella sp.]|jgi:chromosome segregation ATPase|nr:lipoprotein [Prevotella sp.]MBR4601920.1 lipoprotein [Prevotella sp.]MBR6138168.1 lipoprotein [Prevotella sp.]MDO4979763.1 lipoprotein [Prevotellaceae bacterium]